MQKILVANRGEIACRILATAKKMQIPTVAVYSEADANALHVALADEACCIGPAAATQSYLHIENIVAACQKTGADSVHPGYGFLSENADFVAALQARDICFIGPPRQVVAAMGDKIKARKTGPNSRRFSNSRLARSGIGRPGSRRNRNRNRLSRHDQIRQRRWRQRHADRS